VNNAKRWLKQSEQLPINDRVLVKQILQLYCQLATRVVDMHQCNAEIIDVSSKAIDRLFLDLSSVSQIKDAIYALDTALGIDSLTSDSIDKIAQYIGDLKCLAA
jgi:hypothetical protein